VYRGVYGQGIGYGIEFGIAVGYATGAAPMARPHSAQNFHSAASCLAHHGQNFQGSVIVDVHVPELLMDVPRALADIPSLVIIGVLLFDLVESFDARARFDHRMHIALRQDEDVLTV
jgi:hypothetical protein